MSGAVKRLLSFPTQKKVQKKVTMREIPLDSPEFDEVVGEYQKSQLLDEIELAGWCQRRV